MCPGPEKPIILRIQSQKKLRKGNWESIYRVSIYRIRKAEQLSIHGGSEGGGGRSWGGKANALECSFKKSTKSLTNGDGLSGAIHTGVEVCRMDSEMSGLVEWPWLQLMCCAVCLPRGRNFRWWEEVQDGSECWMVCCHWTLEIEFNKRLSSSIIRLANYNVTTSLIYKLIL